MQPFVRSAPARSPSPARSADESVPTVIVLPRYVKYTSLEHLLYFYLVSDVISWFPVIGVSVQELLIFNSWSWNWVNGDNRGKTPDVLKIQYWNERHVLFTIFFFFMSSNYIIILIKNATNRTVVVEPQLLTIVRHVSSKFAAIVPVRDRRDS